MHAPSFLARQLAHPSGFFGRQVISRFMNRSTADHNAMVLEDLEVGPASRVLEVGFGGAALVEKICARAPEGFVAGLEVSVEMIALARRRLHRLVESGRLEIREGTVESIPYQDGRFDKCCSVNTIYFWPDLAKALTESRRVLRPGGRLVLGFLAAVDLQRVGWDRHGFSTYSPDDVRRALAAAGFEPGRLRSGADSRGTFHSIVAQRGPAGR
jgi:SAM-dependent methyltransferase